MIIFDTDILSMFAKANALDILIKALSGFRICITPRVKEELSIPLQYGYSFPQIIFDRVELIFPTEDELSLYENFQKANQSLGKGELEALSIAKIRRAIFAANDKKAMELASKEGITVITVHTVLRAMLKKKTLDVIAVKELIKKIEDVDNVIILDKDKIFRDIV